MSARFPITSAGLLWSIFLLGTSRAQEDPAIAIPNPEAPPANRLLKDSRPVPDAGQPALSFGAIADRILPSVVTIRASGIEGRGRRELPGGPPMPSASGFIISATGHIITTSRPLEGASAIEVVMNVEGSLRVVPARVIGADPATDIALLKVEDEGLPQATLGASSLVRAGDAVLAAGAAMVPHRSAVQGTVAGLGQGGRVIDTDIPVARLDAGGPLVDALGRVIGINIASPPPEAGAPVGHAVPIDLALSILEPLMNEVAAQRAFLGIQIKDLTPAGTVPQSPTEPRQVIVTMIGAGSPAELAGLEVADVVTAVDGQPAFDSNTLRQLLSIRQPGDEVALDVLRNGQPLKLRAVLTELPTAATAPPPAQASNEMLPAVTIANLTAELRQEHSMPQEITGVLVTNVAPDSRAAAMGLKQGDLITQVNRKPATNVEEARDLAMKGEKTVLLKVYRQGDTMLFMVGR